VPNPQHQFNLFDLKTILPRAKVPISAERIREAKALIAAGKGKDAAAVLREVREKLEAFESRLTNRRKEGNYGL